ncbi:GNAT family N-acetyltransferase [Salinivibrio kushneri]|uniref:GNAT family N-acetyltransferase n=1 Tax=Salinivibrio kushneri TaxID=1908198 RepID=UPI0009844301|nr:GNAT family protein [Salinivibrio kushneri]OOE51400.1 GNAT family N-acetyltransferase [Salinivibrio kushneri]OOE53085.1 GNAT family N-acetyltransferase [Salinivibrio kushneri]OOE61256.1 GNAT family N-acetyltransferase [Salinivibrio kushneri]
MERFFTQDDIILHGDSVSLAPLSASHADALVEAATDGKLWDLWYTSVPNAESVEGYIASALDEKAKDKALPFAVIEKESGRVIGSTRLANADAANKRVELGYTWYASRYHRTSVNTECKRLLLAYAFETLGVIAVEFRTHWLNQASRAAIARLGAKQDGVLRNHKIVNGVYRDTVVFSIIESEWPAIKLNLDYKLARYRG